VTEAADGRYTELYRTQFADEDPILDDDEAA